MGIGAEGKKLAAQFPVTPQDVFGGVWMAKACLESGSVALYGFFLGDQCLQNLIQYIGVSMIRVIPVPAGTVAHHIIQVSGAVEADRYI